MKYLARTTTGQPLIGNEDGFSPLGAVHPELNSVRDALPRAAAGTLDDPADAPTETVNKNDLRFGPPLAEFGKLWGIGLNYVEHAGDLDEQHPDEPASFMKPNTALTGPGGPIRLPPIEQTKRVTAEAELGVLVGRECRGIEESDVHDVVAGYLPIIDMTAEDILQRNPRFLTRAKSFDTFLVPGPIITIPDDEFVLADLTIRTEINGSSEAENTITNMLFSPTEIVSFHSDVMTLQPGDLFSTGTPGAAPVEAKDEVRAFIEDIGSVTAPVTR
jgi:2-keto-4-pentenoate hydratase/2-oxohepta-3-ene-1,7-dioic acid hydratase in catechol pathway